MSESHELTPSEFVQPPRDTRRLVEVEPASAPPPVSREEEPRDLSPIVWGGGIDDYTDFRPQSVPADEPDPKVSSAVGSADSSVAQDDLIPSLEDANPSPSATPALDAPAEKDSTQVKAPAPLKPPSSQPPKSG